jgi:hypothetical protein
MKFKRTMVSLFMMVMVVMVCSITAQAQTKSPWVTQQENAHEIAESARAMGLPETDPIIVRTKQLWDQAQAQLDIDKEILTTLIFNESKYCTDEHQLLVGCVAVNRCNRYQQLLYDVVVAPRQYLPAYATPGSYYWDLARKDKSEYIRCVEAARKALYGENDCPDNVLFQANFTQGTDTYKKIYVPSIGTWTYFCYG